MMSVNFHFLNVGNGDCTIVDFPDRIVTSTKVKIPNRVMMVDINHHEDHESLEHVIDYYERHFKEGGTVRPIFRYVSTHPHKDHMTGLSALAEAIPIANFWDIDHEFEPEKKGASWEEYKDDWAHYEKTRKSGKDPKTLRYTDADLPRDFWNQDDIRVLAPSAELYKTVHKKEDGTARTNEEIGTLLNNLSYVLLIEINNTKVVLAGDAEGPAWDYIMKNHADKIKNIDILKASHHGRESGFHEKAVKWMKPKHIVLSAAEDCEHAVPEKYQKAAPNAEIYSTCDNGSLILSCDFDGNIEVNYP